MLTSPPPSPSEERRLPVMQFHVAARERSSASLQMYAFLVVLPPRRGTAVPRAVKRPDNAVRSVSLVWKCNITGDTGAAERARVSTREYAR